MSVIKPKSTIVIGGIPYTLPIDEAKRLIGAINKESAPLRKAADAVIWFDWSNNDDDAVKAMNKLRDAVAGFPQRETLAGTELRVKELESALSELLDCYDASPTGRCLEARNAAQAALTKEK